MLQFIKIYFPLIKILFKWLLKFPNIIENQPLSVKGGQSDALFPYWKSSITFCRKTVLNSTYQNNVLAPKQSKDKKFPLL